MPIISIRPIPHNETAVTPSDTLELAANQQYGFRVGVAGDVKFKYRGGGEFTRTYVAGDEVFGSIVQIYSTGTTATSITAFTFEE